MLIINSEVKTYDYYLKWFATGLLIIGSAFNSLAIYPLGPLLNLAGGLVWLIVAVLWKEAALITTNIVLASVTIIGLVYTYYY
jgi:hypothetical protein|tara:strand:+ start:333 stop:581 length:249 start_codon:yes stop_codon:yes gene_type:complete